MGPDEFHTAYPDADPETNGGLDSNAYTNVMASWVLSRADDVPRAHPAGRAPPPLRAAASRAGGTGALG